MGPPFSEETPVAAVPAHRSAALPSALGAPREAQPAAVPLDAAVTARLEAMRSHLLANRPGSGNEALRLLRDAFPHAPLGERVRAADEATRFRV
jgi:hypothetical protein